MLTLLLKANKRLVISKNARIYQREAYIDVFNLYIPKMYDDKDISGCDVILQYIDPGNVADSETLQAVTEITDNSNLMKEGYTLYWLPIDSKFTEVAGDVKMQLMLVEIDQDEGQTIIMRSSELIVPVMKVSDYFAYVDQSSLSAIDNRIAELKALSDSLEQTEERLDKEMPTDLDLNGENLKLKTGSGELIGEGVKLSTGEYDYDGVDDGILDVDVLDGSGGDDESGDPDGVDDGMIDTDNL